MVTAVSNVRELRTDFAELVAQGLEETVRDIRAGKIDPRRALVVLQVCDADFDLVGMRCYGAEAAVFELVGLLELAKHQTIEQTTPDGDS
jgi:hypothetical protein